MCDEGEAYYNEWDKYAANWLRNLQSNGSIMPGVVDDRSIEEVTPQDLEGFKRCHFFAGIAGWEIALEKANWPRDREVWTGSAPCQPFSSIGKRKGIEDERHLAPIWLNLIRQRRPPTIFGEQVADAIGHGWLDTLFTELEQQGYACAAAVLPAVSVGAPHIRHRLFFVADTNDKLWTRKPRKGPEGSWIQIPGLAEFAENARRPRMGSFTSGEWGMAEWHCATDGKYRACEPGTPPMADGLPTHVGRVRAYGNAIVPEVAARFISAFLLAEKERGQL